ncbi:hypothetical protein A4G18_04295 [Pasteurellaceae bacterium Pebbles2]|nr:hypothetical protein [Pasteurellaceae bacterium Pebbles2]
MTKTSLKASLFATLALGFAVPVHAQALNQIYQVETYMTTYSCYQAKDKVGEVVEYCTNIPTKSVENFKLHMDGYMSEEDRRQQAMAIARKKDEELKNFQKRTYGRVSMADLKQSVRENNPCSTLPKRLPSKGDELGKPNPEFVLAKAENDAFRAMCNYESSLKKIENASRELIVLQGNVEEAERELIKAKQRLQQKPNDKYAQRDVEYYERQLKYNIWKLEKVKSVEEYERQADEKAEKMEAAQAHFEKVKALYEAGEIDIPAKLKEMQ